MSIHRACIRLSIAVAVTSIALFTTSVSGQTQPTPPNTAAKAASTAPVTQSGNQENKVAASEPKPDGAEKKVVADDPKPKDLQSEVADMKAENAAVRELLRRMEEQQKTLLDQVDRLQRRLDGTATADAAGTSQQLGSNQTATVQLPTTAAANTSTPSTVAASIPKPSLSARLANAVLVKNDKLTDGLVIIETEPDAEIPFQLRLTNVTQFRYVNTLGVNDTFTDHLGNVRNVGKRNDLNINRELFTFAGYIFDKRLTYGLLTWTSTTSANVVVSGNISWTFNKYLTINTGYWGVPASRSLTYTFPYFTQPERSLADNFFRAGFTEGVWFTGQPVNGLFYDVFIGNGLNTLALPTGAKIDTHLSLTGNVWWEPLGPYGQAGRSRNAYDDYQGSRKPVIRIGGSYTHSREDHFSNTDEGNPENTAIHNSDGVLSFSTGAFAPGVTLLEATYRMLSFDGGIKYRGVAVNGQYYFRWLNHFLADGPLPISSTFDHGGELSASYFISPKKLLVYGRGSFVQGQFGNSYEFGGGFKWYFVPSDRVWLTGEALRVVKSPYGSSITPYTGGMTGWVPIVQLMFTF